MQILCIADVERDAVMKKSNLEEAVKVLQGMKVKIAIPKAAELQRKRNEAIDMAIEALNNSEIPNSSDTVYRQAAIEQAKELFTLGGCYCDQPAIIGMLNALPSAERKTGRWMNE